MLLIVQINAIIKILEKGIFRISKGYKTDKIPEKIIQKLNNYIDTTIEDKKISRREAIRRHAEVSQKST